MSFIPNHIQNLQPYRPGKPVSEVQRELGLERVIKLASNENPRGPSPRAVAAIAGVLNEIHYYPNGGYDLRCALAERFNVNLENVIAGHGSEGLLGILMRTVLDDGDEMVTCRGTFVGFIVLARASGKTLKLAPPDNYRFDLEAILDLVTPRTKLIYLANPNNPTGTAFMAAEFERFMERVPPDVLVVMDEAYFEYAVRHSDYPDSLKYRFDNVVTLRTFSKAYGLAGVRIGYAFGHERIIGSMLKVKFPFEPNSLAQAAALAALDDEEFLRETVEMNARGISVLTEGFVELGFEPVSSLANFVMLPLADEREVTRLYNAVLRKGIVTRPLAGFGFPHALRVSTGTDEQNAACIEAFQQALSETTVEP